MIVCQTVTSEIEIEALKGAWRSLQEERGLAPFTDFSWIWAWWLSTGKPEGAQLHVVTAHDGDRLVGVLPLALNKKHGVRVLRYAGHDAYYMRNILAVDDAALLAMWTHVRKKGDYDFAVIKNVEEGSASRALFSSFGWQVDHKPVYFCAIGPDPEKPFACCTKRLRRKVQKIREAIEKEGSFTFAVETQETVADEVIPFLVEVKAAWVRQKGKLGLFNRGGVEAFYRAMVAVAAKQEQLRFLLLRRGGALAAVMLCFAYKGTLYAHTVAYDASLLSFMPGLFLMSKAVGLAHKNGLSEANFMEGEEQYKARFSNGARFCSEFVFARSLKGYLYLALYLVRYRLKPFLLKSRAA